MKKLLSVFMVAFILCITGSVTALAVNDASASGLQVEITSPSSIDSVPIHDDTIEITVTNHSDTTYRNLDCFLMILDVGRSQTYPVDEFVENAYQTRSISELAPGEQTVISIPVHIMYVGNFRFTASVINYDTNEVITGNALNVTMTATSNLNKTLVMIVASCVPVVLAAVAFALTRKRRRIRE
ncbi:MAG: hypothetical protein PHF61_11175 [Bacteroidales bacterium]|nr:hypothetical protein [Bacteroidales bacterium]